MLLTTVLFGLLPAVRNSRTATLRVAASPGRWSAGRALLVVELALSVVLLTGAALLVQGGLRRSRVAGTRSRRAAAEARRPLSGQAASAGGPLSTVIEKRGA